MAIGAGLSAQFGYAAESGGWGVPATVTKFLPVRSINISNDGGPEIVSQGLRAGRRFPGAFTRGVPIIGGTVPMEFPNIGIASLLTRCFGAVATTGSGPYTHTFTSGTFTGSSLTCQGGYPATDGTVYARTFAGCKVPTWEIAAAVDEYLMLTPTFSAKSETTATSLAAASYSASLDPFRSTGMTLTIAGTPVAAANSFTITGGNALKTDRKNVNSTAISEQIPDNYAEYTGTIEADFTSLTLYNAFLAATQRTLVAGFANGGSDTFTITANIVLTGSSPAVTGPGILTQSFGFRVMSATSDAAAFTAVLVNTDSSAA